MSRLQTLVESLVKPRHQIQNEIFRGLSGRNYQIWTGIEPRAIAN